MTTPEAFAITCVTCGSRLKVSSRSLVGSIEGCPKCGAMVQIKAPDDEAFGLDSAESSEHVVIGPLDAIDSDAITQSAVAGAELVANPRGGTKPSDARPSPNRTSAPPVFKSDEAGPRNTNVVDEANDFRREVEGPWQNASTQRIKQLVFIALISLFGLIAAVVVFSQFVRTWRDQQVATSVPPVDSATVEPDDPEGDVASSSDPTQPQISESITEVPPSPATAPVPVPSDVTPVAPAIADAGISPLPATPFELTSTDILPDNKAVVKEQVDDAAPPPMQNLPPGLQQYVKLLSLETTENQTARPLEAPPTIDMVRIDEAANDEKIDGVEQPQRKAIDVEKSLALRFAIDNKGASLAELALLVSQLTRVPIEIELISLDAVGIPIDAPIKTPSKFISSREWIDTVCKSMGMVSQTQDDRLMISAGSEQVDAGISAALQLDDFGDDAEAVFKLILPLLLEPEPIVNAAVEANAVVDVDVDVPLPTRLSDDGRSIVPGVTLQSKVRAMLAIEAVRLMRGMAPKLERWRTSRWMGKWPENNVAPDASSFGDWPVVSDGKHGPLLDSPRATADLLRSLGRLNQANVLVGWYDATRRGLYPADPLMPYTDQPTASAMLDEIVGEQGLQTRVCGPSLWYICSEASYDRFEVITWFSIPPGNEEAIRQRLAKSLNVEDSSIMPISFDDNRMLVRCPRFLARQMQRIIAP